MHGHRHSPIPPHPHIGKGAGTLEGAMEYLSEAKKFIQRAREAYTPEARNQHLEMAEWCIARAIEEQDQSRNKKSDSKSNIP